MSVHPSLSSPCLLLHKESLLFFDVRVVFASSYEGIVIFYRPETQTYIQRMEQEKEKAKGQQSDNRSFLAKYVS